MHVSHTEYLIMKTSLHSVILKNTSTEEWEKLSKYLHHTRSLEGKSRMLYLPLKYHNIILLFL